VCDMCICAGWRREVVYRSVSANVRAKSPPSEICYFSPDGTKLVLATSCLLAVDNDITFH